MTGPRQTPALCLALLVAAPGLAQERTGEVREVVSDVNQPDLARALDVVILAEGWKKAERDLFLETAREKLTRRIEREKVAEPLRQATAWNFHYVFVNSAGAAPWRPGYPARDTALRAHVDREGTLLVDDALAEGLAAELAPDVDLVVALVKLLPGHESITIKEQQRLRRLKKKWRPEEPAEDADVGGPDDVRPNADIPGDGARIRITPQDTEAFVHEVGHAAFALGDEYDEFPGEIPAAERPEIALTPNLTCTPDGARWRHVLSTPPIEGGGTYQRGVWRPEPHCRMKESRSRDFCTVCAAAIRGTPGARPPRAPRLTAPEPGARVEAPAVTATLHQLGLRARWRHEGPDPISFHLELRRESQTGREVWSLEVEGHLHAARLEKRLRTPGVYWLGVRADGPGGSSSMDWRELRVVLTSAGVVGVVDDDGD